jgi:hypothetical protein
MLILPDSAHKKLKEQHESAKAGLVAHFNIELEKIMNANQAPDKYWILGKVKFPEELGGKVGRVFLQACMEKPPLVAEAFLYEVDNRRGVKTLLWTMSPGGTLSLPTLGKTLSVGSRSKKKSKRALLTA